MHGGASRGHCQPDPSSMMMRLRATLSRPSGFTDHDNAHALAACGERPLRADSSACRSTLARLCNGRQLSDFRPVTTVPCPGVSVVPYFYAAVCCAYAVVKIFSAARFDMNLFF